MCAGFGTLRACNFRETYNHIHAKLAGAVCQTAKGGKHDRQYNGSDHTL